MAERKAGKAVAGFGLAALAAWPAYLLTVRRWQARWGATGEEVMRPMPGDELVPDARDVSTRAVTIEARPDRVWPWLAQMGYQRGGMYSRIRVQPWAHVVSSFPVLDFGQFLMTRRMLADQRSAGIKERAEALARRQALGKVGAV